MIVFELICADKHRFEGWFASHEDFSSQRSGGLLTCPLCGSASVEKLPTAKIRKSEPVAMSSVAPGSDVAPPSAKGLSPAALNELVNYILLNTEDVGEQFAQEARRIHNQEAPQRDIRGKATAGETRELLEEGIPVLPLPVPPREEWH